MEQPTACAATTDEITPSTSEQVQGSEQEGSEQPISKKPTDSEQRTDPGAERSSRYFSLLDLARLTFSLDGQLVLNAETATNEQFAALAEIVANVTNVEAWHLEERRDFLNGLYAWCLAHNYEFPFTEIGEELVPTALLESGECLE